MQGQEVGWAAAEGGRARLRGLTSIGPTAVRWSPSTLARRAGRLTVARIGRSGARVRPEALALADSRLALTYRALDERADALARGLLHRGIGRGDFIAVYLPNRVESLIAVLAVARAGATFVPMNPRFKARELQAVLSAARPKVVFTAGERRPTLVAAARAAQTPLPLLVCVDEATGPGSIDLAALDGAPAAPAPDVRADDPFSLFFTSGTTGQPKGALGTHRARMLWIENAARVYGLGPDETYLAALPFAHSAGLTFALMHLHAGGTVHILEAFDPVAYLGGARRLGATSALVVPAMLTRLIEAAEAGVEPGALAGLRRLVTCGAPLAARTKAEVLDRLTPLLYDYYGSTESSSMTVLLPEDQRRRPGSVGRPFPNVAIKVAGPDGEALPPRAVGEVCARNPYGMTAYLDDPEATRAAFRDGWFRTGDLGHLDDDGYLHLVGRSTDTIISGGLNIHPGEVEQALLEHEAVAECAVVGEPDPRWGQAIAAHVVLRPGHTLDLAGVQAHCSRLLADYKKPRRLHLVPDLPRNAAGKVMRADLLARTRHASLDLPTIGDNPCPCV